MFATFDTDNFHLLPSSVYADAVGSAISLAFHFRTPEPTSLTGIVAVIVVLPASTSLPTKFVDVRAQLKFFDSRDQAIIRAVIDSFLIYL